MKLAGITRPRDKVWAGREWNNQVLTPRRSV
jgi:hypothetical protein